MQYALDLAQGEHELGNDVQLLVPGRFSRWLKGQTEIRAGKWGKLPCYSIINPLPVTEGRRIDRIELLMEHGSYDIFEAFLKRNSPDIIHIHSFMGIDCTFLEAAKKLKIPVVFTTHDYYGLCPKVNLFKDGKNCRQTDWQQCASCMGTAVLEKKIIFQHSDFYKKLKGNKIFRWLEYSPKVLPYKMYVKNIRKRYKDSARIGKEEVKSKDIVPECQPELYESLREYYLQMYKNITCFHFNSSQSRRVFESYLGNVQGEIIPITNRRIKDNRRINQYIGKLRIGYLGSGQRIKGYQYMKEALDAMYASGMTEFTCHVYFNAPDLTCPYLVRHAPYQEDEMEEVFRNMDVLVVPSLWKETFGMVVLEALSYGVPVIASSCVGAKGLLGESFGGGIIIDIDKNGGSLYQELERIYNDRCILERMNRKICEWEYKWNFNEHVKKILDLYSKYI